MGTFLFGTFLCKGLKVKYVLKTEKIDSKINFFKREKGDEMPEKLLEIIFLYTFLATIGIIIYCVKTKKSEEATKHIIWLAFIPMYLMFIYIPFWYANILLGNNGAVILMMIIFLGY